MAWTDLQEASFRGVAFDCQTISDSAQRAVAQHAYPYRDGADIEDLGRNHRMMRVRAIFFGANYLAELGDFVEMLDLADAGELIHPVFGSIPEVQVTEFEISHEADNVDQASVTVTFIESVSGVSFFAGATATQDAAAIESAADDALDAATSVLATQMGDITALGDVPGYGDPATQLQLSGINTATVSPGFNVARITSLRAAMAAVPALLAAIPGMPAIALANFDAPLNPRAWAADLTALTGGLLDTHLNIGALLAGPAQAVTAIAGDLTGLRGIARQVAGLGGVLALPDAAQIIMAGFRRIATLVAAPVRVLPYAVGVPVVASGLPLTFTAAQRHPTDTNVVALHAQSEFACTLAVAARRVLDAEAQTPLLTPAEIEEVADVTRATLEAAISAWRTTYAIDTSRPVIERLRNVALLTQASAQSLIERHPPLVTQRLAAPANMRLLAHRLYGDHTRAAELMRLNHYGRTPLLDAGDTVQAYAS